MLNRLIKPSLHRKLFWSYFTIITFSAVVVGFLSSKQITHVSLDELSRSLQIQAHLTAELAKPVLTNPSEGNIRELQNKIAELGSKTQSRFTVIKIDGDVLADSEQDPSVMNNHSERPEVLKAKSEGFGTSTRFSHTVQKNMSYLAMLVKVADNPVGYVRVSVPLSVIDRLLDQLHSSISISAGITTLFALVIGFLLVKRFSAPLESMTSIAKAIAQGDYSQRINTKQKDEIGQLASAFNIMAETSERRLNEIIADRNRLAIIFTGMVEGVINVDDKGKIRHINQTAANMLGISSTACINQPLAHLTDIEEITQGLYQATHQQEVVKNVMRRPHKSGRSEVWKVYVAPVRDEAGHELGAVVVLNDVSDLAYLEKVRRDFVGNASHELKTPITVIRGLTETILDDREMPEEILYRFIQRIDVQIIRLSSLVSDLLTLSRLDDMQKEVNAQRLNLNDILSRSLNDAKPHYQEKQINLTTDIGSGPFVVEGDKQALSQMLDNLIINAIKYTPQYGSIHVSMKNLGENLELRVKDTGIGISEQHQKRIFERFYRVDNARSRELGGTGLGLSIVKNIVERHQGEIRLESRVKHGSTFIVTLPLL